MMDPAVAKTNYSSAQQGDSEKNKTGADTQGQNN